MKRYRYSIVKRQEEVRKEIRRLSLQLLKFQHLDTVQKSNGWLTIWYCYEDGNGQETSFSTQTRSLDA